MKLTISSAFLLFSSLSSTEAHRIVLRGLRRALKPGQGQGPQDNPGQGPQNNKESNVLSCTATCNPGESGESTGIGKPKTKYSVCFANKSTGAKKTMCLPEDSALLDQDKYPDNFCGSCGDDPPVTDPPITGPPVTGPPDESEEGGSGPPGEPPNWVFCFSGQSLVEVEHRGLVKMADLSLGDAVHVGNNKFEPIYSFGHRDNARSAEYLQISTTQPGSNPLEISHDHMVAINGGRHVPASFIKEGELLLTSSGDNDLATVTHVKTVTRKGIFAPFTASGSIVVNGIIASNYIAYQQSEYLKLGDFETPLSYQWVAHIFKSYHRLANMLGFTDESYTEEGISQWVDAPHKIFSWILAQDSAAITFCFIALALPVFCVTRLLEVLVLSGLASLLGAVALGGMCFRNKKGTKSL